MESRHNKTPYRDNNPESCLEQTTSRIPDHIITNKAAWKTTSLETTEIPIITTNQNPGSRNIPIPLTENILEHTIIDAENIAISQSTTPNHRFLST
jgi:hypothetical protein